MAYIHPSIVWCAGIIMANAVPHTLDGVNVPACGAPAIIMADAVPHTVGRLCLFVCHMRHARHALSSRYPSTVPEYVLRSNRSF